MLEVINPKLTSNDKGDSLTFALEVRLEDGALGMRVNGCRVLGGWLFGPARVKPGGGFVPQVEFFGGLKDDILKAIERAGWRRDFPKVKFPERPAEVQ